MAFKSCEMRLRKYIESDHASNDNTYLHVIILLYTHLHRFHVSEYISYEPPLGCLIMRNARKASISANVAQSIKGTSTP
jgi:hypothetical protein